MIGPLSLKTEEENYNIFKTPRNTSMKMRMIIVRLFIFLTKVIGNHTSRECIIEAHDLFDIILFIKPCAI